MKKKQEKKNVQLMLPEEIEFNCTINDVFEKLNNMI